MSARSLQYLSLTYRFRVVLLALFCLAVAPGMAFADEDTAPATAGRSEAKKRSMSTGTNFFDDGKLLGGVYYFQRNRMRYSSAEKKYKKNLRHASAQANLEFNSGFIGNVIGVDIGVFGSTDLRNSGAVDHEMGFVPWGDPWHPDWSKTKTEDGFSIYKAHLKTKIGPTWAKAGWFQPTGPGILGVNWSIMPGTYRGVEAGVDVGGFSFAGAWVDEYKAPWYTSTNNFLKQDKESHVPYIWSLGGRYTFDNGLSFEVAYGESKDFVNNAHFKTLYPVKIGENTLTLAYSLYTMDDADDNRDSVNNLYAGRAYQHFASIQYDFGVWMFNLEGTYTQAPQDSDKQLGYFAYRTTVPNGSSKGAYGVWWDARSDWNHDEEKAVFLRATRKLDDILPVEGFSIGAGAGMGWDGEAYGVAEHLREWAFTGDLKYTRPEGPFKGSSISLHYLEYRNGSHQNDWDGFKNGFQDERDVKLLIMVPFSIG